MEASTEDTAAAPILRSAHAIRHFAAIVPSQSARADLRGVIIARRKAKTAIFFDLSDTTQSVQLIVSAASDPDLFSQALTLQVADRVHVSGVLTRTQAGVLTVAIDRIDLLIPRRALSDRDLLANLSKRDISPRFLLARLGKLAQDLFEAREFLQFSPHYISTRIKGVGVEPLDVVFPGWGATTSLVPSPLPQLLEAAVLSGTPRVFSACRLFSRTIRDGFTSSEAYSVCAVSLEHDLTALMALASEAVIRVLEPFLVDPATRSYLDPAAWFTRTAVVSEVTGRVEQPTQIVYENRALLSGDVGSQAFRVLWPPDVSVVEGHVAHLDGVIPFGVLTVHLERVVRILYGATLRRIRYCGPEEIRRDRLTARGEFVQTIQAGG